jgi:hypothetical protein
MDGIPPYELILIPGKNDKISPISHTYFTNDSNRITLPLPYKRDTTITTIVSLSCLYISNLSNNSTQGP